MVEKMMGFPELFKSSDDGDEEVQRSEESSRVRLDYWRPLYPKYCNEVNKEPEKELKKPYSNEEIKPQKRSYQINKPSPPPDPQEYNGLEFGFEWSGGDWEGSCRTSSKQPSSRKIKNPPWNQVRLHVS